jgi:hypothetical protein
MPIRLYGVWSSSVKRKKLLFVLLSSKMLLVIHQLSVLNRDMFSSRSAYRTYAETSLLARRPLPSSCVELGGTSLVLKRQLTLWTFTILNWTYSMFVCSSIYRYITNLVCYAYFHWLFNPECQHIFGKQTGIYVRFRSPSFGPQKTLIQRGWQKQKYLRFTESIS